MGDGKNLPTNKQNLNSVQLHDNGLKAGSLLDVSLNRLTETQTQNLLVKAGEEALRLQVKRHEQDLDYAAGKKATEDHIDTFNMLDRNGKTTRQAVISDIKTGAGNMRIESKSGPPDCFVATAAYGDPNHPDVIFLRHFRDNTLVQSKMGRAFIAFYYKNGPTAANSVKKYLFLSRLCRSLLTILVSYLKRVQ